MSQRTAIDLHARRAADLAPLRALARALEERGEPARLSTAPDLGEPGGFAGTQPGPLDAGLRVLVEDPHEPLAASSAPAAPATALVVLWNSAGDPARELAEPAELLHRADLVLVPGFAHSSALCGRVPGRVEAVGLPALDGLGPQARTAARARWRIAAQAQVWLYAPSTRADSPLFWFPQAQVEALGEGGALLALAGAAWPAAQRERYRALAARWPTMLLLDEDDPAQLLALADAVIADAGSGLLGAAAALGLPCAELARQAAAPAVGSAAQVHELLRGAAARPADPQRLVPPGRAAARAAELVAQLTRPQAADGPAAATTAAPGARRSPDWLEPIEAQLAFGDLAGARAALEARAQREGGALVQRTLARAQRLCGELAAAEASAARACAEARSELAASLCEQARTEVEHNRLERARELFEEAGQLDSQTPDPAVGLGSLALHAADGGAAEAHFRRALLLEKSARAWSGLGLALCAQGRSRDALWPLASALDLDPECQAALYGLVQAALQTGELALAADRLQRYVEQHPGNLGFAYSLAAIALQLGQLERAREAVERIELFDPGYPGLAELRAKLEPAAAR